MKKTLLEVFDKLEANKEKIEFLPTGFRNLDESLDGGFMRQELVIIGAPTGRGKSFVAGTIFHNIARGGFKSAYFSLEISNEMVVSRLIGANARIKPTRIMAANLSEEEYQRKIKAKAYVGTYAENMFFYDDLYILAEIQKEIEENKYEFVVIDFLQNIVAKSTNEYERLSFIAIELQKLAKKVNCCILALSQLSNAISKEKHLDTPEYKGSGSIATACDLGFFIEPYTTRDEKDLFMLKLRKNRRGESGIQTPLVFVKPGGDIYEDFNYQKTW